MSPRSSGGAQTPNYPPALTTRGSSRPPRDESRRRQRRRRSVKDTCRRKDGSRDVEKTHSEEKSTQLFGQKALVSRAGAAPAPAGWNTGRAAGRGVSAAWEPRSPALSSTILHGKGSSGINNALNAEKTKDLKEGKRSARTGAASRPRASAGFLPAPVCSDHPERGHDRDDQREFIQSPNSTSMINMNQRGRGRIAVRSAPAATGTEPPFGGEQGTRGWSCRQRVYENMNPLLDRSGN